MTHTYDARFRRTKIVATVGPASSDEPTLLALIEAGVNVFRVNSSHGTPELRAGIMDCICDIRARIEKPIGLLVDLQGPRIRIGTLGAPIVLEDGSDVTFAPEQSAGEDDLPTTYEDLAKDVAPGDRILVDDGLLQFRVRQVRDDRVVAQVVHGGTLKSNKGMNLPGIRVSAPSITVKDKDDIELATRHGADFVGMSFVRRAEEVWAARGLIPEGIGIVAKIELATALQTIDRIVEAADVIMVARGDLGVELPFEEVPLAQKRVIEMSNRLGRPVITATQILESMIDHPRPTRAEASDVANAVLDGTDAVMLSAETAVGAYPVQAVRAMARIVERVEASFLAGQLPRRRRSDRIYADDEPSVADAIAAATVVAAKTLRIPVIVCFTSSGFTARLIAAARPDAPIVALTPEWSTFRQLAISWGVVAMHAAHQPTYEKMLDVARDELLARGYVQPGDRLIVTAGVPFDVPGTTNLLKIEVV